MKVVIKQLIPDNCPLKLDNCKYCKYYKGIGTLEHTARINYVSCNWDDSLNDNNGINKLKMENELKTLALK